MTFSLARPWSLRSVIAVAALFACAGWIAADKFAAHRAPIGRAAAPPSPAASPIQARPLVAAPSPAEAFTRNFDARWRSLAEQASTTSRAAQMAAMLEDLARHDPARAIDLAAAEKNLWLSRQLREAALRGWAAIAPDDALSWAMALRETDNRSAIAAVLAGAASHPAAAVRLAEGLCAQNPFLAADYGRSLIEALGARGAFTAAAQFATAGAPAERAAWLNAAFVQWAQNQPREALKSFREIDDPTMRQAALDGLFLGWSQADPAGLASYAIQLPDERDRSAGLGQALSQWIDHDPAAASLWLNRFEPRPELDAGMLTLATSPTLIEKRPEVAVDWARGIADPIVRAGTLHNIAQQWARRDTAAAQRFAANLTACSQDERAAWAEGIQEASHAGPTTGRVVPPTGDPRDNP